MELLNKLPQALLPWYEENHRKLPWREVSDPYRIWVSEIMLQQTRVEAVKGYYARFLEKLPDIASLANADDELLHKLWEGLGYYTRVRNLKKAAIMIMEKHNGRFPEDYAQVLALPGIGEYTAGAICSIAFQKKTPAVDGNVLRVLSRLTDDHSAIDLPVVKKAARGKLLEIYPVEAGMFTQALMELGATVCGPNRKPECVKCPCNGFCLAYQRNTAEQLPVRSPKCSRKIQEKTVFIIRCGDQYALIKRPEKGLLANMWQFPDCPGKLSAQESISKMEEMGFSPKEISRQVERNHVFTHIEWVMNGVYAEVADAVRGYQWFTSAQIREYAALPTAYKQFWDELNTE